MSYKHIVFIALCILSIKQTVRSEIVFHDNFNSERINAENWDIVLSEGKCFSNKALLISNDVKSTGWDKSYVLSKDSYERVRKEKVLSLTIEMALTEYAAFIVGFVPAEKYFDWSGIRYGFIGDRLDRALWFMQGPKQTHLFRFVPVEKKYQRYKLRMELGIRGGVLWQYDVGDGWKTARDTRNTESEIDNKPYRLMINSYFYASGEMSLDNLKIEYVKPSKAVKISKPKWPQPVNAEFNGRMDKRWTNWAGDLGVSTPLSVSDFQLQPGRLILYGPKDGFGMYLRHYPFLAKKTFPFYAIVHMKHPQIHKPQKNYRIIISMLTDLDGDLYTDDIAYPSFALENVMDKRVTKVQLYHMDNLLSKCIYPETAIDRYWENGDLYLLIGFENKTKLICAYKFSDDDNWKIAFDYDLSNDGKFFPVPIGLDLIGPCRNSGWVSRDYCDAGEVSYEIDYVHFENKY